MFFNTIRYIGRIKKEKRRQYFYTNVYGCNCETLREHNKICYILYFLLSVYEWILDKIQSNIYTFDFYSLFQIHVTI